MGRYKSLFLTLLYIKKSAQSYKIYVSFNCYIEAAKIDLITLLLNKLPLIDMEYFLLFLLVRDLFYQPINISEYINYLLIWIIDIYQSK